MYSPESRIKFVRHSQRGPNDPDTTAGSDRLRNHGYGYEGPVTVVKSKVQVNRTTMDPLQAFVFWYAPNVRGIPQFTSEVTVSLSRVHLPGPLIRLSGGVGQPAYLARSNTSELRVEL